MTGILWLILSYLLGSFPSGYLIAQLSGKNVLKIGWRKTSGSNVFKNVGKWQGALTGILDVGKGYLAVYGAQRLGLSSEIQILSGVAAVTGHNWSLFLKFAGGRGIGTFIGAFFALSPQILLLSIIPLALLAIIWTASIGTLLFLATAIFLSIYFNQFEIGGFFTIISLVPILIKRLSPISEVKNFTLFRNRLIFDNDTVLMTLRIKKIFQKEKNNPGSLTKVILAPPKIGWRAAKFGVKVAKKPVEKLFSRTPEKVVTEIRKEDLKKIMIASAKKIVLHQEEINKINVFPVADKDTGYNLAATLLGIEGTIAPKTYLTMRELAKDIEEASLINARGNAGMIYTGYLIEVLDRIKHLESIDAFHLALAMKRGIKAANLSIAEPVEGTILDVIKAAGERVYEVAKFQKEKNIIKILEEAQKVSQVALQETKEKLEVLKKNDVVDAGALGFVKILEAWIENLKRG
jgi:acyl-phosphate glycerol 3-phosphate acyltransferase